MQKGSVVENVNFVFEKIQKVQVITVVDKNYLS